MRSSLATLGFLVAATMTCTTQVEAQRRSMRQDAPRYDTGTETTVKGTVQEVKQVDDGPGMRNGPGTHVVLRTEAETIDVHLGPSAFLSDQQLSPQTGDTLEVVGSRVKFAGTDAILAREVRKDGRTVTLRDAKGFPKWSRRPRR